VFFTNSAIYGLIDQRDFFDKDIAIKGNTETYYIVEQGDYVYNPRISELAPVGPTSRNNLGQGIVSPLYTVIRFRNSPNNYFELYFKSNHWVKSLKSIGNKGARHDRMSFSISQFLNVEILHPSNLEQPPPPPSFSTLDELIDAENKKLEALKVHKKGLMQQLFPAEGETVPRLRFKEFRESGEWEIKKLSEIAENLDFRRIPITENEREKGEIPYYGASGIIDYVKDFIFDEDLLCVSEDGANLIARTYPIAFSLTGKTWVNNHAHVLKFEDISTQIIIENYLNAISLNDYLTGMAQPKLNRGQLDIIQIPLPEIDEQKQIVKCLSSLDELISTQNQKIESLKLHKKGLMQGLFPTVNEGIE